MSVLLDLTSLCNLLRKGRWPHGIPRVGLMYLEHYQNQAQCLLRIGSYTRILSPKNSQKIFAILRQWRREDFRKILVIWANDYLTNWAKSSPKWLLKTDLTGFENKAFLRLRQKYPGLRILATVHDLIPVYEPELCPVNMDKSFEEKLLGILAQADRISLVSEQTQRQFLAFCEQHNKPSAMHFLNPLASGLTPDRTITAHRASTPYFVCVGTVSWRKNQRLLLQIWQRLHTIFGEGCPKLILIGKLDQGCQFTLNLLEKCHSLQDVVRQISISDRDMQSYLRGARAALMPNLSEGYGLPLIEALTLGTPVIASDIPIFREVGKNIPDYIDHLDALAWLERILEYTKPDSILRQAQLSRMAQFEPPGWEAHFLRLEAQLENTL